MQQLNEFLHMGGYAAYAEDGQNISYNQLQDKSCKMLDKVYQPIQDNLLTWSG